MASKGNLARLSTVGAWPWWGWVAWKMLDWIDTTWSGLRLVPSVGHFLAAPENAGWMLLVGFGGLALVVWWPWLAPKLRLASGMDKKAVLEDKLKAHNAQLDQHRSEITELRGYWGTLRTQVDAIDDRLQFVEGRLQVVETVLKPFPTATDVEQYKAAVDDLKTELKNNKLYIAALREKMPMSDLDLLKAWLHKQKQAQ